MYKNKMREIRQGQGILLKQISQETGISVGYLCLSEKGTRTNPSVEIMEKISRALKKDVKDVFFNWKKQKT